MTGAARYTLLPMRRVAEYRGAASIELVGFSHWEYGVSPSVSLRRVTERARASYPVCRGALALVWRPRRSPRRAGPQPARSALRALCRRCLAFVSAVAPVGASPAGGRMTFGDHRGAGAQDRADARTTCWARVELVQPAFARETATEECPDDEEGSHRAGRARESRRRESSRLGPKRRSYRSH